MLLAMCSMMDLLGFAPLVLLASHKDRKAAVPG